MTPPPTFNLLELLELGCPIFKNLLTQQGEDVRLLSSCMVNGISADSRKIGPGKIFVAIKGNQLDGHDFIPQALERGAVAIITAPCKDNAGQTVSLSFMESGMRDRIPLITLDNPAVFLARAACFLAGPQPDTLIAVTGTNGKTSTADFLRQLWQIQGRKAASLGTLGLVSDIDLPSLPALTTPDSVSLATSLAQLKAHGIEHVVLEASSHGIEQHRLDGLNLSGAGFSNLTRDHLDYHHTMARYREAKLKLFSDLLPAGSVIAFNADMEEETAQCLRVIARERGLIPRDIGENAEILRLIKCNPVPEGQSLHLTFKGRELPPVILPLPGRFQVDNALLAAALCWQDDAEAPDILASLKDLRGVSGRCEYIASLKNGASAYVDYAHTPDALAHILQSLRPHAQKRLFVVFGAGGNRDKGKRPLMGQEAARHADYVIITDDNPRHEDPAMIRDEILTGIKTTTSPPSAFVEIVAGRRKAIAHAASLLEDGDILLVAGKGHEQGQIIGDKIHPFDDREVTRLCLEAVDSPPLWSSDELRAATGGMLSSDVTVRGICIDTRQLRQDDLFIALIGHHSDGHQHIAEAFEKGASCVLAHDQNILKEMGYADDPRILLVRDSFTALEDLGRFSRARFKGKAIAITGSVGKTTTKEMLRLALSAYGRVHASVASYNNHWGVPLTLARLPAEADFCISEVGMNHPGEIQPLAAQIQPCRAIITTIGNAHLGHMGSMQAITAEKASLLSALTPDGIALVPDHAEGESPEALLTTFRHALPDWAQLWPCGYSEKSVIRLNHLHCTAEGSQFMLALPNQAPVKITLNAAGRHLAHNAAFILGVVASLGLDPAPAIAALAEFQTGAGRGAAQMLGNGTLLLDESYNASGLSMRAALENLTLHPASRHIAALGDILELGEFSDQEHRALAPLICQYQILCFCCGVHMKALYDILPETLQGGYARDSTQLASLMATKLQKGDVLLVKGSFGSKMRLLVTALETSFPPPSSSRTV